MIDKYSHIPVYLQIERILSKQIEEGLLLPGESIPSETLLAEQYQVSRMTARKAVDYLVRQGIVERQQGKGTFICEPKQALKMSLPLDTHLTSSEVAESLNASVTNKLIHLELIEAPKFVSDALETKEKTKVWFMKRLRLIDNIPFVFESSYMLYSPWFEDIREQDLNSSKYRYLASKGKFVKGSTKQIRAELPSEEVRGHLKLKRDEPVLFAESVAILEPDIKFEISQIYYNQQHYIFTLEASR